jgi:hypothetical protein
VDWESQYRRALEQFIDNHSAALLVDPAQAESVLDMLKTLSSIDLERIDSAVRVWDRVWEKYARLVKHLRYIERPAIALSLDDVGRVLEDSKKSVRQRRWGEFLRCLEVIDAELAILENNSSVKESQTGPKLEPASGSKLSDPYCVLNVSRSATPEEIHRSWLKLASELNKELSNAHTETERHRIDMARTEINVAWSQIQLELKCAKGLHNYLDNSPFGMPDICKICKMPRQPIAP